MLGSAAGLAGSGTALSMGASSGTIESAASMLGLFCMVFIPLCIGGLVADKKNNKEMKSKQLARRDQLAGIAYKYNAVTELLEQSFNEEKKHLGRRGQEKLRQQYEQKYLKNKAAFDQERKAYLSSVDVETPTSKRFNRFWQWVVGLGLFTQLMACSYTLGIDTTPEAQRMVSQSQSDTYWNADNIPMPHLTDGSRYVSNPDGVVSDHTEQLLNQWFKKMDDSLQIESAVVLVNHIENDDPFRMAQDLGNKYGVGKADRGLVIILGYEDHSINISPGRSLEADLTDAECARLQREYVIPSMKAELPDSGMLYLAEAIYNTLQQKELPQMSAFTSQAEEESDVQFGILSFYFLLFGGWFVLIVYLINRYQGATGRNMLAANPFQKEPEVAFVSTGGGGGGGSFGGGGGFSGGGGFGGGSFGGGGATSRW